MADSHAATVPYVHIWHLKGHSQPGAEAALNTSSRLHSALLLPCAPATTTRPHEPRAPAEHAHHELFIRIVADATTVLVLVMLPSRRQEGSTSLHPLPHAQLALKKSNPHGSSSPHSMLVCRGFTTLCGCPTVPIRRTSASIPRRRLPSPTTPPSSVERRNLLCEVRCQPSHRL
jgi:hypothetical protein